MIAYYIRSIDGENITLKALVSDYKLTSELLENTSMVYDSYEEKPIKLTVKSDELEELASKSQIFGYNPTTKKAKVVDLEEVASMIIAKHKLICNEILNIEVTQGNCEEDDVLSLTLQNKFVENENGEMTVTITMPQYLEGMFSYCKIDYYEIYEKMISGSTKESSIMSNLIFDFKCPQFIETDDLEYFTDYAHMSVVKIRNISFSERFDMNNLINGGYMFCFSSPEDNNNRYFDTKDVVLDLSRYSVDNLVGDSYMFATIEGNIRLPKLCRNTSASNMFRNKDIDREELLMYINDLIPFIHDGYEEICFEKCTFVGITPEEVDTIKKYTSDCYAYILTDKGIGKRVHI